MNQDRQQTSSAGAESDRGGTDKDRPRSFDEQTSPEQLDILRRMTPEGRWRAAQQLYWTARRHKAAFIHSLHPEWSESRVEAEVLKAFSNART